MVPLSRNLARLSENRAFQDELGKEMRGALSTGDEEAEEALDAFMESLKKRETQLKDELELLQQEVELMDDGDLRLQMLEKVLLLPVRCMKPRQLLNRSMRCKMVYESWMRF